ncbi:MAG: peptidylprolyl isomerase [Cyclobacteriaceae bacterium]|nr:peptidylprolyl isomerase [Cyclobacteriaceae bacterium]UYN86690.1 MAG: peptidylprolyl isomerase [Cyclobacteriaceae bacterium]
MMIRSAITILVILFSISASAQRAKKQKPAQILFSVNNRPVPVDEFIYLYKKNHQNRPEDFSKEKIEEYLGLFVNFKLKVEEARNRGLDTTRVFVKEFNNYKEELRRPYLPEGKMLDSLVRLTYKRLTEEVKASHILINAAPDASPEDTLKAYTRTLELKARVTAGEDFGTLAAMHSEDPSARTNKGNLGYFTAMQMVYPFESAAYSGKPGEVVGPVRTRFGYHLVLVEDRKPARGEVEVSHIMIRTGGERPDAKSKNLIFEIYDQLKGGVAWEELCALYSEDGNSKNNGGRLRPFGVGAMAAAPEFDAVAFALQKPGEISDPFQTAYGWHMVRLERKIPLPSYEELLPQLKPRVQRDERVQISKQALLAKLKKDFLYKENEAGKSKVFARADSTLTKGKWSIRQWQGSETIFTIKTRSVPAKEFVQYVNQQQRATTQAPKDYMEQLYASFVESVINQAYEDQLVRANPDYEMLLREYYEGILLFDIMEREVWNRASEDTTGQRAYYQQHSHNFMAGERVVTELYSAATADQLEAIKTAVEKDDANALEESIKARRVRFEKGTFQKSDRPVLSGVPWAAGTYTTENNGMYYLVRIFELLKPGPLAFEEARAAVISEYQNYLEKRWVEQLRKKYAVKIDEKGKQYVFKQLVRS